MIKTHSVTDLHFENDELIMIIDGVCSRFALDKISLLLKNAPEIIRNNFEVSPSGYGIHWPGADEDLSIDALLGIPHERNSRTRAA